MEPAESAEVAPAAVVEPTAPADPAAAVDPAAAAPTDPAAAAPEAFHEADGEASQKTRDAASPGPTGGPVKAFTDCNKSETFADGRCHPSFEAACEALSCSGQCIQMRSMPPQARCSSAKPKPKPKGREAKAFTDCERTEAYASGRCYPSVEAACAALSCKGKCMQLKSMPPQAKCV